MIRHSLNSNLTIHYESFYKGLPVLFDKGPFILEYLDKLLETMDAATTQYRRVFAFRLDLRFPEHQTAQHFHSNEVVSRFIASMKAKINHNRETVRQLNKYAHDTVVRYIWAREVGQRGRPHYHLAILLNYDAFCAVGKFTRGRHNMFNRLEEAWASALGVPVDAIAGLIEIPRNPSFFIYRDNHSSRAKFFSRASYLCKSATKEFGDGIHGFGASRT